MSVKEAVIAPPSAPASSHGVSFREAFGVWVKIGLLSFGGPAGQIATMHRILVDERKWVGETRFLHALNYCMLLPGPEAQQLAVYIGWLMNRTAGGLVAGILFVVPGVVAIMALSLLYATLGNIGAVQALFFGLKAAVLAIVVEAVLRIGKRALRNATMVGLAVVAFVAIFVIGAPFPLIIAGAALVGFLGHRFSVRGFSGGNGGHGPSGKAGTLADADSRLGAETPAHARVSLSWSLKMLAVCLFLWFTPVIAITAAFGGFDVFADIGVFFSKMAVVTFGGAYAVLAYVAQEAVTHYGWLHPGEMLDGLGMAETTPGPLIMVLQFVGFMAAFRDPGTLDPLLAGVLGGLLATWVTFVPCFMFIFVGAPFIEALRDNKALAASLSAITAAVVGVVMNLAIWFALHMLFAETIRVPGLALEYPILASLEPWALVLTIAAMLMLLRYRFGMITTLGTCAIAGLIIHFAGQYL
jgi:chromate transporter